MQADEFDVVVVGAGLVGACAALLFARADFRVAVVEARSLQETQTNAARRVSALNLATKNIFSDLQVWNEIGEDEKCQYRNMKVWDANSDAKIEFAAVDYGQDCLGHIVNNRAALAVLYAKLIDNYKCAIFDASELISINETADGLAVAVGSAATTAHLKTELLVGCDGGDSVVKRLCNIESRRYDFCQDAITAEVKVGRQMHSALQCFLPSGAVAMLPLSNSYGSVVWSVKRELVDELMVLGDAEFAARLQQIFGGGVSAPSGRRRFALVAHHAQNYIAPRVALVGDAAHMVHPLAGLGANLGLADAAALVEVVVAARARGLQLGQHSVLRRYERWRRGQNAVMQKMLTAMNDIFISEIEFVKVARRVGMNMVDALDIIKYQFAKIASGVHNDAPQICKAAD